MNCEFSWQQVARLSGFLAPFFAVAAVAHASPVHEQLDLADMSERAEFVFSGRVIDVSHRDSDPRESGLPGVAHTFVTFQVENVLKGRAAEGRVTLRFFGGPNSATRFTLTDGTPLFDLGDRDLLFVHDNGSAECPLVGCADGRVRLIDDKAFSDLGQRLEWGQGQGHIVHRGAAEQLEAVTTHHMSDTIQLRFADTDKTVYAQAGPAAAQIHEAELLAHLRRLLGSPAGPGAVAFQSADRSEPFRYPTTRKSVPLVAAEPPAAEHLDPQPSAVTSQPRSRGNAWFWAWAIALALAGLGWAIAKRSHGPARRLKVTRGIKS
jgi:hypothetical protein